MTISYAGEVPNGSNFGCFWKILWKWRGSVYKLVWRELIAYLFLYYTINLTYRFVLNDHQQKIFTKMRIYFGSQSESIPMSFVFGFYVNIVVNRWWSQYKLLPWPDTLALFISAAIPNSNLKSKNKDGKDSGPNESGRLMRRNIMRYMVLSYVITLQRISLRVKRRFPSPQHLVDAGLMHESERKIFEAMDAKSPMSKYWMPLVWATNIINRARRDEYICSDHLVQTILVELSDIRRRLGALIGYDTVCVPLVYTQVVTLVLYTYFVAALLGKQMLPNMPPQGGREDPDLYFPLFTVLQFIFYVGWLKVAEVLINPFGEDDDDIELNWLIDRHIKASYMIVDEMHEEHPELLKDNYWEEVVPKEDLPYTIASEHYRRHEPRGSAENYKVKEADAMYANIIPSKRIHPEDVYADYESVDTPLVERRKKNWLSRQVSRMGSMRSQSTAYSSGGLFNRTRLNSVYSSPESGLPLTIVQQQQLQNQQSKPTLYDKFVHRKSLRVHKHLLKENTRLNLNGINNPIPKNRPRIPTPDVTKESVEKENKINMSFAAATITSGENNSVSPVASGVALMASQLATTPSMYPYTGNQDMPVMGTLLLSPIKEIDCNSAHNTLQPGHPATAALAQAVLPKNLQEVSFGTVSLTNSSSHPITSNITTLSIPIAVTSSTTNSDTTTLSIVPLPQITTTPASEMITNFPFSLSIPRAVSVASITELNPDGLLSVTRPITRARSYNSIDGSNTLDTYVLKANENTTNTTDTLISSGSSSGSTATNPLDRPIAIISESSVSAPSTLNNRKPEPKTGEVYV